MPAPAVKKAPGRSRRLGPGPRAQLARRRSQDRADQYNTQGLALIREGNPEAATIAFRAGWREAPGRYEFGVNLSTVLLILGRADEAREAIERSLALRWDLGLVHENAAIVYKELGLYDAMLLHATISSKLQPDSITAQRNYAGALEYAGHPREAEAAFDRVLRMDPTDIEAHVGRGLARLYQGNFWRGWPDFEWRNRREAAQARMVPDTPQWRGEKIAGTLLLNGMLDGFGDAIMAARYLPEVRRRCDRLIVACLPAFARLAARWPGIDEIIVCDGEVMMPPIAAQSSFHSVLAHLDTRPDDWYRGLSMAPPPYVAAETGAIDRWRDKLDRFDEPRIGVVWQGDPTHCNDRRRSFRLEQFAPLARAAGVPLISLQRGHGADQAFAAPFAVVDLGPDYAGADVLETAAVIANLDLVICCDTGIAHLAAAMGKPVWIALDHAGEWRWLQHREDSPWYPTVRLFRQSERGDWAGVFGRMAEELADPCSLI